MSACRLGNRPHGLRLRPGRVPREGHGEGGGGGGSVRGLQAASGRGGGLQDGVPG